MMFTLGSTPNGYTITITPPDGTTLTNWIVAALLVILGSCVWVRRRSFRCNRWERALTLSVIFQALAYVLCAPEQSQLLGRYLAMVTGKTHMEALLGHLFFIASMAAGVVAVAWHVVPDRQMEYVHSLVERPAAVAAAVMLAMITLSHTNKGPLVRHPDFFDTPCDNWLRVYWIAYWAVSVYLMGFVVRLLLVARKDPRSRRVADLFIVAATIGLAVLSLRIFETVFSPSLRTPDPLIWGGMCLASLIAVLAAAQSWRNKTREERLTKLAELAK